MGTTADKLTYLNNTKGLLKDRLNSLGAAITSSTTFRNYLTWLDTFYEEVSDKTDLSQNGVVGRTSQDSTTGKNVFELKTTANAKVTTNDNKKFTYIPLYNGANDYLINGEENTAYTVSVNLSSIVGADIYIYILYTDNTSEAAGYMSGSGTQSKNILKTSNAEKTLKGISIRAYNKDTYNNYLISEPMVRLSTETDTYEPYTNGASPNPDYPQPVNNLTGNVDYTIRGKNAIISRCYATTSIYSYNIDTDLLKNTMTYSFISSLTTEATIYVRSKNNNDYVYQKGTLSIVDNAINTITFNLTNEEINNLKSVDTIIQIYKPNAGFTNDTISKAILEQGSSNTTYEPYVSQTYPISLASKNLFDNVIYKANAGIRTDGTTTNNNAYNLYKITNIKPSTTYTMSENQNYEVTTSTVTRALAFDNQDNVIETLYETNRTEIKRYSRTFTTPSNVAYIIIQLRITDDEAMLEEGSTASSYESYHEPIELCKISTYQDRIYKSNDKWYLEKNIGKVVLDGSENWQNWTISTTEPLAGFLLDSYVDYNNSSGLNVRGKSNYFKISVNANSNEQAIGLRQLGDDIKRLYVSIDNTIANDLTTFKEWLSNNNTLLYYVLATPTTTEITSSNYPELYVALKEIQDYLTSYKINKEFILGYSSPNIEY